MARAKQKGAYARAHRHDFEQSPHYHDLIERRMQQRGVTRGEAYRSFIDDAVERRTFATQTIRERARSIRERAATLARSIAGAAGSELAAIIADARRIEELA